MFTLPNEATFCIETIIIQFLKANCHSILKIQFHTNFINLNLQSKTLYIKGKIAKATLKSNMISQNQTY